MVDLFVLNWIDFIFSGAAFVKAAQAGYYDAIIVDSSDPIGTLFYLMSTNIIN